MFTTNDALCYLVGDEGGSVIIVTCKVVQRASKPVKHKQKMFF